MTDPKSLSTLKKCSIKLYRCQWKCRSGALNHKTPSITLCLRRSSHSKRLRTQLNRSLMRKDLWGYHWFRIRIGGLWCWLELLHWRTVKCPHCQNWSRLEESPLLNEFKIILRLKIHWLKRNTLRVVISTRNLRFISSGILTQVEF